MTTWEVVYCRAADLHQGLFPRLQQLTNGRPDSGLLEVLDEAADPSSPNRVALGYLGGRLVGWAALVPYNIGRRVTFHVFVDHDYRQRGLGAKLAQCVLNLAALHHPHSAVHVVLPAKDPARQALYRKLLLTHTFYVTQEPTGANMTKCDLLQALFYDLLRDCAPAGVIEKAVQDLEAVPVTTTNVKYSNEHLAKYADELATRVFVRLNKPPVVQEELPAPPTQPPCRACRFSFMEPDDNLTCGHPESGTMGQYVHRGRVKHCKQADKFEQHPQRNPDGSLKHA